jgi:hypothetical protein
LVGNTAPELLASSRVKVIRLISSGGAWYGGVVGEVTQTGVGLFASKCTMNLKVAIVCPPLALAVHDLPVLS